MNQYLAPQFRIFQEQHQAVSCNGVEDFCELLPICYGVRVYGDELDIHIFYNLNNLQEDAAHLDQKKGKSGSEEVRLLRRQISRLDPARKSLRLRRPF